jgi:diguanylate cyclase (GGDEF)-like protein
MLDPDHFKAYNDAHGHQAGDDFLRKVALDWEERTRIEDHIARYGGEEFVITLPNTDIAGAKVIVERLRTGLPEPGQEDEAGITCSAGIAEWDGSETVRELVARADQALYQAKESGRDRTVSVEAPGRETGFTV